MSGQSKHPETVRPYRYGLLERLYLPLIPGLLITLRHFIKNLVGLGKSNYTIQYPEERREYSHRYRGHHILTSRPDGECRLESSNDPPN